MQAISLLWPAGHEQRFAQLACLDENSTRDLDLETVLLAFGARDEQRQAIARILCNVCADPAVIRYRQDVVEDLARHPDLAERLEELLPTIHSLGEPGVVRCQMTSLHEVCRRLGELANYVACVQGLSEVLGAIENDLHSEGLRRLGELIAAAERDETFIHLVEALPDLLENIRGIASITIGVNLDAQLQPIEATLLSVNQERFTGPTFLSKLLGKKSSPWEGVAQLHTTPKKEIRGWQLDPEVSGWAIEPMLQPLFRDLAQVTERISQSLAKMLVSYIRINGQIFTGLDQELAFYLGALRLIERLRAAGLPLCRPELAPMEERVFEIEAMYNLNLALFLTAAGARDLKDVIVANRVTLGEQGRIAILTGPNQGGKTVFTQAIGLAQLLAQAGLPVPGRRARISPADGIYTHFPIEERPDKETGRLGDEAKRFHDIFSHATQHSLILLNESLSSTSAGESLYLAQDIVRILRRMGVRAVFSTHLHELAAGVDALNAESPSGARVISLVASLVIEDENGDDPSRIRRSYKVIPAPPMGYSCAREIARRYGIGYEQLAQMLQERGVLEQWGNG